MISLPQKPPIILKYYKFGPQLNLMHVALPIVGKLQSLSINGNRLTKIAPELGRCKALRNLNLQTNQIPTIPESFTNLQVYFLLAINHRNAQCLLFAYNKLDGVCYP